MTPEREKNKKKTLGNRWFKLLKEMEDNPIDYSNYEQLAKDCWLFLTNNKMPARANIKKDAFISEVKIMIESAVLFSNKGNKIEVHPGPD